MAASAAGRTPAFTPHNSLLSSGKRGSLAPTSQDAITAVQRADEETVDRTDKVAQSQIASWQLVVFCMPICGSALATWGMWRVHRYFLNETNINEKSAKMQSDNDITACLTASIVSHLFTAYIAWKYVAIEALAFTMGSLAVAMYSSIAASREASAAFYHRRTNNGNPV